jgi:hypothetical protein
MITAGVLAALLMNTLVFPKHCRVNTDQIEVIVVSDLSSTSQMLFLRNSSRTLGLLSQLYLTLSRYLSFLPLDGFFLIVATGNYSNVIGHLR